MYGLGVCQSTGHPGNASSVTPGIRPASECHGEATWRRHYVHVDAGVVCLVAVKVHEAIRDGRGFNEPIGECTSGGHVETVFHGDADVTWITEAAVHFTTFTWKIN